MPNHPQSNDPQPDRNPYEPTRSGESLLSENFIEAHAEIPAVLPSGGDFYDAFAVPDDPQRIAVVMGDVAGHGPEQAEQAEHMRELLADCLSIGLSPADTLAAVNAMIEPDPHFDGFSTVFIGTIDEATGQLTYASGGHEPALIAEQQKRAEVEELNGTGPPVGAFPPEIARFEQHSTHIPEGGSLLLYTDGIPDAAPVDNRSNWLGLERLKKFFSALAHKSPRETALGLLRRVGRFCRGYFRDDVALMVVRRKGR